MTQSGKLKIPDGTFFISEYSVILSIMENLVMEVSSLLDLEYDVALLLLQSCRWNKEKLMDQVQHYICMHIFLFLSDNKIFMNASIYFSLV
jgi:hypothetical protein